MPRRFLSAPAKKPRTVWGCQSVALMICSTVAPAGRFNSAMTFAYFVSLRSRCTAARLSGAVLPLGTHCTDDEGVTFALKVTKTGCEAPHLLLRSGRDLLDRAARQQGREDLLERSALQVGVYRQDEPALSRAGRDEDLAVGGREFGDHGSHLVGSAGSRLFHDRKTGVVEGPGAGKPARNASPLIASEASSSVVRRSSRS
jgi:hypothetical protein